MRAGAHSCYHIELVVMRSGGLVQAGVSLAKIHFVWSEPLTNGKGAPVTVCLSRLARGRMRIVHFVLQRVILRVLRICRVPHMLAV